MTRLAAITGVVAALLLITSGCHHQPASRTAPPAQAASVAPIPPLQTAHQFLTAILSGDLDTAKAVSSPLLTQHLTSGPANRTTAAPSALDLLLLSQDARDADVAVELHWPNGNVAALRLRLVRSGDRWLVAEAGS